jgi:subfamily B ATP-binding cassette protein MsbA
MSGVQAYLMQPILDDIFISRDETMLYFVPLVILVTFIIKGFANYGQDMGMRFLGQRIVTDMQVQLYRHLLYTDMDILTRQASGKLISRFTNDINIMRRSVSNVLTSTARESLTFVVMLGLMLYQSLALSFIAFVVLPVAVYPILRLGKRMRKISHASQEEMGQFTERLDETFKGIRVIRAYRQEESEIIRAGNVMERIFQLYIKASRTESLASPIMETLTGVAIAGVVMYGGLQVISEETTPGAFFSFMTALMMAYKPMKSLTSLNTALQEGLASAKRFFVILDVKPAIVDKPHADVLSHELGDIELSQIDFSYDGQKTALDKLCLTAKAGSVTALVGPSGGGKSTIFNLILRFYDAQSGTIRTGGKSIADVTLASLRDRIAIVTQDVMLFDDTVAANIAYARPDASKEEIQAASIKAAADEFIRDLPLGYETVVGQNGITLSGGQRQRIAIARAILADSPILLLDEATSALDPISEQKIQKALEELMKSRTTLIIAHRLSTVEHADIIHVLKKGKVVESGNHNELVKQDGEYAKLYYR